MNNIPDEILLHLLTYINVFSSELKPLLEINKRIRNILYYNKYTLNEYPGLSNESVACICNSFFSFINDLKIQKMEANNYWNREFFYY